MLQKRLRPLSSNCKLQIMSNKTPHPAEIDVLDGKQQ